MSKFYLAYGSNLNRSQMRHRCPDAVPVGISRLHDYKLVFRRGFLTIEPDPGSSVPIGVWKISDEDERHLNVYEGFPRFYRKESMLVKIGEEWQDAIIYIMNDGFPLQGPGNGYYTTVRQGYIDFAFKHEDFENLWNAMDYATRKGVKT